MPHMGTFTIKVNGYEVSASTPADAAELLRELSKGGKASDILPPMNAAQKDLFQKNPRKTGTTSIIGGDELEPMKPEQASMTLEFLKAIRDGGATGVTAPVLMKVLGVTAPKAIGSKSATINKIIKQVGLADSRVYTNPKTANGRIWRPARRMNEAIQLIEKRLDAALMH